jgi:glutathione S-transferase
MKLYYSPGACSLSPHIVLQASGLAFTLALASTKTHQLQDGTDYYSINPLGYVPLLELDDGTLLSEGPAIVQYIADQVPEKNLAPANGTLARYQMQSLLNFISTELHKGFSPLFNPATPADFKPVVIEKLLSRMAWIDSQLAGKDYLMGEHLTAADAYLFTVTGWGGYVKVDLSGFANIAAFRARMSAQAAVQAALRAEGLLK